MGCGCHCGAVDFAARVVRHDRLAASTCPGVHHSWSALTALPVFLAVTRPGFTSTRHVIAVSQMLISALLIHLTGGRIETHFHVFGSLAFLACYRDWRVLVSATIVIVVDHLSAAA